MKSNKTVLITGATSGIGKATVIGLIRNNYSVHIVARNPEKAKELESEIKSKYGKSIGIFIADISDFSDVRRVAAEITATMPTIDVLINNAGLYIDKYAENANGVEMTMATNHFGPFLLTNLLLPKITNNTGRIINVSSGAHFSGRIDLENINLKNNYSPAAYANSKLANILFTKELARKLVAQGITVNCLHPGLVRTNFGNDMSAIFGFILLLVKPFFLSPESGARTSIYLATSPEVSNITGEYFVKCKIAKCSAVANDAVLAEKLWKLSEKITA